MKLHVHPGPLPILPPYLEWEDKDPDLSREEEEIDLTDLFERPKDVGGGQIEKAGR